MTDVRWTVAGCTLAVLSLSLGCGKKEKKEEEGTPVSAVLKSSNLSGAGLRLSATASLVNVTGLADSLGLTFTENLSCGFDVWAANGQSGRAGLEGRTYEAFDLGDPTSWTSKGAGLQGECDSATVSQVESYFAFLDLHLLAGSQEKVVRAYLSEQPPFEAGDLVLNAGGMLSWYDVDKEVLVPEADGRPKAARRLTLAKEIPWYDNNGADKVIMMEFRINVDISKAYVVTKDTAKVVVDLDFTNSGIAVADTSSDAAILKTLDVPFLEASNTSSELLSAALTVLTDSQKGTSEDPEPQTGN